MKNKIKWAASVLLLLVGLGQVALGSFASFLFFSLSGLLCMPPTFLWFERKTGMKMARWHKYLTVLFGITIAAASGPKTNVQQQQTQAQPLSEKQVDSVLTTNGIKAEQRDTSCADRLKSELDFFDKPFDESAFRGDVLKIQGELLLFAIWAGHIRRGESCAEPEAKGLAAKFRAKTEAFQVKEFPKMRKAYGDFLKEKLWENDIEINITGANNTVLNITGHQFVTNKNKAEMQNMIETNLKEFRFKQCRYRWYKGEDEYTYYEIKSQQDKELYGTLD